MPKSIDIQIEQTKEKIKKYQNRLIELEEIKLNMVLRKHALNKKDIQAKIKKGISVEEILKGE